MEQEFRERRSEDLGARSVRGRQPERMLRVIAETTERVDVFRTRRVRTCLSLSVNKIHPSLHEPTLSASFLPYELCYNLSLNGRILLSKAEGISRLTYAAISLEPDKAICKKIDQQLCNFVWKNKTHYVKKSVLSNSYSNGGLNFVDFATLNNTFKINWLRNYLKKTSSIWNIIPAYEFSQLGGLHFLLLCSYSIEKIPVALSNFHKQALLAWSIFKHNFSPTSYFIWNNKNICYKHKSLFFENWFKNGINQVSQLFYQNGFLFTYQ